jgi:DNA-binding CsgD family transcriptional regulator
LSISADAVGIIRSGAMHKAGLATRVQVVEYVRALGRNRS